ncbi:cuticle protein CP14.6-like [Thrips palmi]|uniref:Cuticle protein CP14.6-like n=1 Tax=Thrips palmi TaxID=161013 RepID=A0A6P8ZXP0_THRPL|nr:cuticle protein CP14.6-like [Thrips palmi]
MKVLILAALFAVAAARPDVSHLLGQQHHHHHVQQAYVKPPAILRQVQETSEQGDYKYSFKTENGIEATGQALLKNAGNKDEALVSEGSYSYVGEDGQTYTVNWTADEYGFRAAGAHIPEIPEEIRKGLEQSANEPEDDGQYREDPNAYDRPQFQQQQQVYRRF